MRICPCFRSGLLFTGFLIVAGCQSFRAPTPDQHRVIDGRVLLDPRYLKKKQTIEAKGVFDGNRFSAASIEIEDADDEIEVKSVVIGLDERKGTVGGVTFELEKRSRILGLNGESLSPTEIEKGVWVKAECKEEKDRLFLRKLQVRERREKEEEQIQGEIASIKRKSKLIFVGKTEIEYGSDTPVFWTVEGAPPPLLPEEQSTVSALFSRSKGVRKIRRLDDEDRRPDDQLTFGEFLTVGGEIQYDAEWREEHDLNDRRDRDRLLHGIRGKLELSFDIEEGVFGFLQVSHGVRYVHFDQDKDLDFDHETRLKEAFVLLEDLPIPGISVQVGRQDFDYGREWVVDENLDAVRFYFNLDKVLLELSASSVLYQENTAQEDVWNILLGVHGQPWEQHTVFGYALQRRGGKRTDFDRIHVGASAEGEIGWFTYWSDASYVFGKEDDTRVEGFGFDQTVMCVFGEEDLEPSVYLGYAYGSGDDRPDRGEDHSFRQTGLHDNNDHFNGVTSFRYLGELVRPEVSNLSVVTVGVGLRSDQRNSVDLVYHRYRQVEAAPLLRSTRLRRMPNGTSKDVGCGIDLIIGLEQWRPWEIEIVLGFFRPGSAFPSSAEDAWFGTLQVEWNF